MYKHMKRWLGLILAIALFLPAGHLYAAPRLVEDVSPSEIDTAKEESEDKVAEVEAAKVTDPNDALEPLEDCSDAEVSEASSAGLDEAEPKGVVLRDESDDLAKSAGLATTVEEEAEESSAEPKKQPLKVETKEVSAKASPTDGWALSADVTGMSSEMAENYQGIDLSWDETAGADGYAVYRQAWHQYGLTYLGSTPFNRFADREFPHAGFYFYWILPYRYDAQQTPEFGQITGYVYGVVTPPPIENLKAESINGDLKLTWDAVPGATHYRVYRRNADSASFINLGITDQTSYLDDNAPYGMNLYLVYSALQVNQVYLLGPSAPYTYGFSLPQALDDFNLEIVDYVPELSWQAVPGATHYMIYRQTGDETELTPYQTVTGTSFRDRTAIYGKNRYQVRPAVQSGYKFLARPPKISKTIQYERPIHVDINKVSGEDVRFIYGLLKTNHEFAAALIDVAQNYNTHYIYGSYGQPVSNYIIDMKYKQYPYYFDWEDVQNARTLIDTDTFAFDCVGLMKGLLWGWNGDLEKYDGGAKYVGNGVPDYNTSMLENVEDDFRDDAWNNIQIGEAVHMPGHIGFYIGSGLVVESTYNWSRRVMVTALENRETMEEVEEARKAVEEYEEALAEKERREKVAEALGIEIDPEDEIELPEEKPELLKDPLPMVEGIPSRSWVSHGKLPYLQYVKDDLVNVSYTQ